ncbi:MAG: prepilin-type N-terminal cleavage/methylation domain-containing protein [Clostridia bacterium]|nr:prepilin-type N-terminal cleavage/methylation domain-containing protein [Clostridia bacterium]
MKKGFTLVETVVALAVIVVISFAFFSMATFASVNLEKSNIKNYGIIEMQGVSDVFSGTNFASAGQFSVAEFEESLAFCGYELKAENEGFTFSKKVDGQGQISIKGKGLYQFWVSENSGFVTLSGKIFYEEKVLYQMPNLEKVVNL